MYLKPDLTRSYDVRELTGLTCVPYIELKVGLDDNVTIIHTANKVVLPRGITIDPIATFDQGQAIVSKHFIRNADNHREAYLEEASLLNRPQGGQIGDVQAKHPRTIHYNFDRSSINCYNWESFWKCIRPESYLKQMIENQEARLPLIRANHKLQLESNGEIFSELLMSAPLELHINADRLNIKVMTRKVCPQIERIVSVNGCHSCAFLGQIRLIAFSTCLPGPVKFEFQFIEVSTRTLSLTTHPTKFVVEFQANVAYLSEKLCLSSKQTQVCTVIEIKLDEPILKVNTLNYTLSKHTGGFTSGDGSGFGSWFLSGNLFDKIKTGATIVIIVLVSAFVFTLFVSIAMKLRG